MGFLQSILIIGVFGFLLSYFAEEIDFQIFYFKLFCFTLLMCILWCCHFGQHDVYIEWVYNGREYEMILPGIDDKEI